MLFVYLQPSLLIFCKIGSIIFPYHHLQQRPQEWRTHFQFSTLYYHRFFSFCFYLLWSTSQLPSIMSLSEEITLTLKKALWLVVQKLLTRRTLILRWVSLFLFASRGRSSLLTSWRIGVFLTLTHISSNNSDVLSHTPLCLNVMKPPFL